jgi:type I site-specific restriction endonuclease
LDKNDKKKLRETDICDLSLTPAIKGAGWDPVSQIRRDEIFRIVSEIGMLRTKGIDYFDPDKTYSFNH